MKDRMRRWIFRLSCAPASMVLLVTTGAHALTRVVPDHFSTIQGAIAASGQFGDTVLVRPGTYREHLDFLGKDVVLRSVAGPETTIVDAAGLGASVVYLAGCGETARLEGFTLRGGSTTVGGGIYVRDSHDHGPMVDGNWIIYNAAIYGGGVRLLSTARVQRNRIAFNEALVGGGGIRCEALANSLPPVISENEIFGNRVTGTDDPMYSGGGIYILASSTPLITRNIIACNDAPRTGGMIVSPVEGATVEGNTVFANWGHRGVGGLYSLNGQNLPAIIFRSNVIAFNLGGGVECAQYSAGIIAECNDVHGNNPEFLNEECTDVFTGNSNINEDPLFGQAAGCPLRRGIFV